MKIPGIFDKGTRWDMFHLLIVIAAMIIFYGLASLLNEDFKLVLFFLFSMIFISTAQIVYDIIEIRHTRQNSSRREHTTLKGIWRWQHGRV